MSRRKLKMLFWAVAAVLAFIPFLQGCAADDGRTDGSEGAGAEGQQNEQGMQDEGSPDGAVNDVQAQDVQYGQVVSVDGDEVTVLLGEYAAAAADADSQSFAAGEDQITFDLQNVKVTDEMGADRAKDGLAAGALVERTGTGTGMDFTPESIMVVGSADALDTSGGSAGAMSNTT